QHGTVIGDRSQPADGLVKAIAHRVNSKHAVVGCVGDGLSNGSEHAAKVRRVLQEIEPALKWESTALSNLVTTVERDQVATLVRRVHQRLFDESYFRCAASSSRSTSFKGDDRP
ncbi:MAG TPA: hypothetical protein VFI71_04520, partial [Pyrinomonadaceae bacterium]|nr:hypothetical protein [Pyrinomonadaceae bacterium]